MFTLCLQGGELLDNYGPHFLETPREERQSELAKQYFFTCECEACLQRWPTIEDMDTGTAPTAQPVAKQGHK